MVPPSTDASTPAHWPDNVSRQHAEKYRHVIAMSCRSLPEHSRLTYINSGSAPFRSCPTPSACAWVKCWTMTAPTPLRWVWLVASHRADSVQALPGRPCAWIWGHM